MSQYAAFSIKVSNPCPSIIIIFAELFSLATSPRLSPATLAPATPLLVNVKQEPKTPRRGAEKGIKRKHIRPIYIEILDSEESTPCKYSI